MKKIERIAWICLLIVAAVAIIAEKLNAGEIEGMVVPEEVEQAAVHAGASYGISPELLEAIAFTESSYRPDARNGSCIGLMQVDPDQHAERIHRLNADIWTVDGSMMVAADYLAELFLEWEDLTIVLDIYNGNSRAEQYAEAGTVSEYAEKVTTLSAALERAHGK